MQIIEKSGSTPAGRKPVCPAMTDMDRVNRVLAQEEYRAAMELITERERERIFCNHTMEHFLAVARLTWILYLEAGDTINKEVVYAAALLHDIGRAREYTDGTSHDEAGAGMARTLLPRCGFTEEETEMVCQAILGHRLSAELRNSGKEALPQEHGGKQELPELSGGKRELSEQSGEKQALPEEYGLSTAEEKRKAKLFASRLKQADHLSRNCFACKAEPECYWPLEKKNMGVSL